MSLWMKFMKGQKKGNILIYLFVVQHQEQQQHLLFIDNL